MRYLYYLTQIGISQSPISNNYLFLKYRNSPFKQMFEKGLNIALSTDDPLQFHMNDNPLFEEYSVAKVSFGLSQMSMCEIAFNSVKQSSLLVKNSLKCEHRYLYRPIKV